MAIRGTLQEMSLGDLLQLLALGRKQGRLVVATRGAEGVLVFEDGAVADAGSGGGAPRLPRRLLAGGGWPGAVPPAARREGATEGEAAAALVVVAPERVQAIRGELESCVDDVVCTLLGWSEGRFTFEGGAGDDAVGMPPALRVRRPVDGVLLEAARRADEWPRLRRVLPSLDAVPVPVQPLPPDGTEGVGARLWRLMDGHRSAQALADTSGLDPFSVAEVLVGWAQAGAIRLQEPPAARAPQEPVAAAEQFRQGVTALRQAQWERAVALLAPLAGASDAPAAVHHNLALGLEQLGRPVEAARHAAVARERAGGADPRLAVSEAMLAIQRGDAAQADRLLGSVPVPDPCPAAWYHARGVAALLVGDVARAGATLEAGVVAYPGDAALLVNLGAARLAAGDADEATRVLQRAVRTAPALPAAHKALGDAHYAAQRWDEALRAYREAVALAPSHGPDVHGRIGDIHFRRGDVTEARAAWARALAIDPAHRLARGTGQGVAA